MNYRRIHYRYGGLARELEPRPLGDAFHGRLPGSLARPQWRPPADLYEGPEALFVKVELAGMSEEAIGVELYEDTLVIEGERRWKLPEGVTRFNVVEIPYGPFRLEIAVPQGIDREAVEARYEGGILQVKLPRAAP